MSLFTNIIFFQTLDSTSEYLKRYYAEIPDHTIVVASYQTEGKGQFERTWESQEGKNLLFSILFKDNTDPGIVNQSFIKSMDQLLRDYEIKSWFKEPNDIYVYEKKIAGILMETKFEENNREYLIVGIGINVNQQYFEIENAVSMSLANGITYVLQDVLAKFLEYFEKNLYE
ncbi:MAG: biotin--[acetyl-CoA-carboxylase] ligase [Candidatus Izemoplasmatales bacterium]